MKIKRGPFLFYFLAVLIGLNVAVHQSGAEDIARGRVMTGINLRAAPGLAGKVITALESGTVVTITGEQSGWYQITWENESYGYRGWVYGKYIEKFPTAPVKQAADRAAVEKSPAPAAAVQKSEPLSKPRTAKGAPGTLPPDMPTNTIELIQASTVPEAVATNLAAQAPPPGKSRNQPVTVTAETGKPAKPSATETEVKKEPSPVKAAAVINAAASPGKKPDAGPGPGNLLGLVLKLSSVLLSCLALMISYRTFHLVTAAGRG